MKYYLDITLLPDAEANLGFIWQKAFQQVHIALVDNKVADNESAVALSIVGYGDKDFPLGKQLRLLAASEDVLQKLDIHRWLNRLSDYCYIEPVKPVPSDVPQYARFMQKRVKGESRIETQLLKKAKHISEKFNVDYETCLSELQAKSQYVKSSLPFINVESQQTKKRLQQGVSSQFLLFIEQTFFDKPVNGKFDCYGLSKTATVPWF
ncbi:type I-F CRISPR-associated endoribonuclease Cas6/Csy4 [Aliiglaciecola sp. LCG003]|uniref:type I-F CRISPR-associated endoribonuclease Cas6/Csy4 n=1 Tax=Aliiglaciecola sp. LCG003 TaxID=3053655 RepID=UPI002573F1AF|nr:type I-F CRISPR-associated endoribonuclease Cas6/Csy4 [Aliiglaciecola sp. LCG003]WJG10673.1 type I-F CRISPR-associated endoribonuclease Cas6/Csy4 [Aliiglaciecola sp. LCG003]